MGQKVEYSRITAAFTRNVFIGAAIVLATATIYYFSNPAPQHYYDYTYRLAENFFHGKIGYVETQTAALNELIPAGDGKRFYSAFPYGSVVSMVPFGFLKFIGLSENMPAGFISAVLAALACWLLLLISGYYDINNGKKVLLVLGVLFGTFMWTNQAMAGAWHLALGFALVGELGAIYCLVYRRNVLLAGAFFAVAFGNRTEILLIAPVFMYLLANPKIREKSGGARIQRTEYRNTVIKELALFCTIPFVLGVSTLGYNYLRFGSPLDFGYSHIPGVLAEPWYRYGIFSLSYIPNNIYEMLLAPWRSVTGFPYYLPSGFGGSILMTSPWLFFLLRSGSPNRIITTAAWCAIAVLTFLLWIHGNPGGYQFSYRYAMILLPWIFLIIIEKSPKQITKLEWITFLFSFIINAYATYLFFWTKFMVM